MSHPATLLHPPTGLLLLLLLGNFLPSLHVSGHISIPALCWYYSGITCVIQGETCATYFGLFTYCAKLAQAGQVDDT